MHMEVIIGKWMKEQQETSKKKRRRKKKPSCTEECEKTALCLVPWFLELTLPVYELLRPFFTGCHCVCSNKCLSTHTSEFVSTSYS